MSNISQTTKLLSLTVRIRIPKKGSLVKFHNSQYQFRVPFVMYTDFEAILEPIHATSAGVNRNPNLEMPYTKEINKHTPSGFCVNSKVAYAKVKNPLKVYRLIKKCIQVFCNYISNEARRLYHMFPEKSMKALTRKKWRKHNGATTCHICRKGIEYDDIKVRDHCHYSGQYRGPAHRSCNLKYKIPNYIPIVFHNPSGYDDNLFIRELGKKLDTAKIGVISENEQKYISFSIDVEIDSYTDDLSEIKDRQIQLRFIDSMRFMVPILNSLRNNLVKDGRKLTGFDCSEAQYQLIIHKGVYPYEYMVSWSRFEETRLPLRHSIAISISTILTNRITPTLRKFGLNLASKI